MAETNVEDYGQADEDLAELTLNLKVRAEEARRDPMTLLEFLRPQLPEEDIRVVDDVAIRRLLTDMYSEALRHGPEGWIDDVLAIRRGWGSISAPSVRRSGSGTANRTASPRWSTPTGSPRRSPGPGPGTARRGTLWGGGDPAADPDLAGHAGSRDQPAGLSGRRDGRPGRWAGPNGRPIRRTDQVRWCADRSPGR
ncbi:hypothetical protein NKG94_24580 [Micromonospora sp. M12]